MSSNILSNTQKIHLVGIKGVAMTALAQCLQDLGKEVTGSDIEEDFVTHEMLEKLNIHASTLDEHKLPNTTELVIFSGAHKGSKNAQVKKARDLNIPVLSHAEALGLLMKEKRNISVCGVGGKTTTSSMISWIFEKAGLNPSFAVGVGNIFGMDRTGKYNKNSDWFIAEADEYCNDPGTDNTPRFLFQNPFIIVCTNIAFDHPDVYATFEETKKAFLLFFSKLPQNGVLIVNADDAELMSLIQTSFGETIQEKNIHLIKISRTDSSADIFFKEYKALKNLFQLTFSYRGKEYTLALTVPGEYNAINALYAIAVAQTAGIEVEQSIKLLLEFKGTMRRFENKGIKQGIQYYDDYAHHPSEINRVINELSRMYSREDIIVVFQPHTYSRTKALFQDFIDSLSSASKIVLIDIFGSARELFDPTVSSDFLVKELVSRGVKAENAKTIEQAASLVKKMSKPGNVVITLGAGDIYKLHEMIQ